MPKPKLWNWEVADSIPLIYVSIDGERQRKYGVVLNIQDDKTNNRHIKVNFHTFTVKSLPRFLEYLAVLLCLGVEGFPRWFCVGVLGVCILHTV